MYIQEYSGDPAAAIAAALATPDFRKSPTVDTALNVTAKHVEKAFKAALEAKVKDDVGEMVEMYTVENGDWSADMEGKDEYESALDDMVENYVDEQGFVDVLSASWLGTFTIDSQVWLPEGAGVAAFATGLAKEAWKQLNGDKTPAQMLANAGVTRDAVEAAVAGWTPPQKGTKVTEETNTLDAVIGRIKAHVGKDHDAIAVYEDLEMITTEDDEILTGSAGSRLGISAEDVAALQIAALDMDEAADEIYKLVEAHGKPIMSPRRKQGEPAAVSVQGATAALAAIKECGAGDTAMAEALGVSRTTYTNWLKGKGEFVPDQEQFAVVRGDVVERLNKLIGALNTLDGSEMEPVE